MNALLSLLGLYNYDDSILDGLTDNLPDGVDADTAKTSILAETAELEVIYPDPTIMKTMISVWGKSMKPVWAKMYATTTVDYNPIYNYDRTEEWTDTGSGKRTNETGSSGKVTDSGNRNSTVTLDSDSTTSGTDSGKTTGTSSETSSNNHNVVGFNGTEATLDNSDVYSGSGDTETESNTTTSGTATQDDTTTTTETNGNTRDITNSETVTENSENNAKREGRAYGNIGVTTTQTMLKQERDVAKFDFYEYLTDCFKQRFCLMVY